MRRSLPAAAAALVALLAAGGAGARAAGPEGAAAPAAAGPETTGDDVFFESLDVTLVNVDVYVSDREGRRVRGLDASDFEVFEDGRPVQVTNFYAVEGGREVAPPPPPGPPATQPPAPPTPLPGPASSSPPPPEQRLSLVVYFDDLFLRPFNRNKVVRLVRGFLGSHLRPGDRAMLVTFERSLHVRQPFTADPATFGRALDEVEKLSAFGVQTADERREVLRRIEDSQTAAEAEAHAGNYADAASDDAVRSIEALKDLVGSLAGLPGRKALLYVSDGIPMTPGEEMFVFLDQRFGDALGGQMRAARYRLLRRFRELAATANANRVTLYTLQAQGLAPRESLSAEYGGNSASYLDMDVVRQGNLEEPLELLAEETGGLAAVGTNDLDGALERMAADFEGYYSLGYRPAAAGDGRYRSIEVRVKGGKGLTVRHRSGYRDKTPETRVAEGTLAALLYGAEVNPLGIEVAVEGTPEPRDDGHFLVPLAVRIPLAEVTLVPQGSEHRGRLRVALAVADAEGHRSDLEQTPVPITVPAADLASARGKLFTYAVELLMRRGDHLVAVGVRDDFAGTASFLRRPLRIGG